MIKYSKSRTFKLSEIQDNTLNKLEGLGINVSQFIRLAIAEKIKKDYKKIKEKKVKKDCPF